MWDFDNLIDFEQSFKNDFFNRVLQDFNQSNFFDSNSFFDTGNSFKSSPQFRKYLKSYYGSVLKNANNFNQIPSSLFRQYINKFLSNVGSIAQYLDDF